MVDRPVLFSAPMVQAILREIRTPGAGKTQTRRLLKIKGKPGFFQFGESDTRGYDWTFRRKDHVWEDFRHEELLRLLPIQVGDRLWVRESWQAHSWAADCVTIRYRAEQKTRGFSDQVEQIPYANGDKNAFKFVACKGPDFWRPSIHMARWASRITLEVTDVRFEPLQDINAEDARAEGVNRHSPKVRQMSLFGATKEERDRIYLQACKWEFEELWDSINGTPRKPDGPDISWGANPWVMAVTFTPSLCNISQMAKAA